MQKSNEGPTAESTGRALAIQLRRRFTSHVVVDFTALLNNANTDHLSVFNKILYCDLDAFVRFIVHWNEVPDSFVGIYCQRTPTQVILNHMAAAFGPRQAFFTTANVKGCDSNIPESLAGLPEDWARLVTLVPQRPKRPVLFFLRTLRLSQNDNFEDSIERVQTTGLTRRFLSQFIHNASPPPVTAPLEIKDDPIRHKYVENKNDYSADIKAFVHVGKQRFLKKQQEWISDSKFGMMDYTLGQGDSESDDDESDVPMICQNLRAYKEFDHPVPLRTMVDILTVMWNDDL